LLRLWSASGSVKFLRAEGVAVREHGLFPAKDHLIRAGSHCRFENRGTNPLSESGIGSQGGCGCVKSGATRATTMRPSPKPTFACALSANFFCIFGSSGKSSVAITCTSGGLQGPTQPYTRHTTVHNVMVPTASSLISRNTCRAGARGGSRPGSCSSTPTG
jgi:hypothetical protein